MAPPTADPGKSTGASQAVPPASSNSQSKSQAVTRSQSKSQPPTQSQPVQREAPKKDEVTAVYGSGASPRKRSPKGARTKDGTPPAKRRASPTRAVRARQSTNFGLSGPSGEGLVSRVSPKLLIIVVGVCLYLLMPRRYRFILLVVTVIVAYVVVFRPRFLCKPWESLMQKIWPSSKAQPAEGPRVSGTHSTHEESSSAAP